MTAWNRVNVTYSYRAKEQMLGVSVTGPLSVMRQYLKVIVIRCVSRRYCMRYNASHCSEVSLFKGRFRGIFRGLEIPPHSPFKKGEVMCQIDGVSVFYL
jgi:hypothetical protein